MNFHAIFRQNRDNTEPTVNGNSGRIYKSGRIYVEDGPSGDTLRWQALASLHGVGPKHGHDVFYRDDKQLIVCLKVDRNRVLGMKQNFIVLP